MFGRCQLLSYYFCDSVFYQRLKNTVLTRFSNRSAQTFLWSSSKGISNQPPYLFSLHTLHLYGNYITYNTTDKHQTPEAFTCLTLI